MKGLGRITAAIGAGIAGLGAAVFLHPRSGARNRRAAAGVARRQSANVATMVGASVAATSGRGGRREQQLAESVRAELEARHAVDAPDAPRQRAPVHGHPARRGRQPRRHRGLRGHRTLGRRGRRRQQPAPPRCPASAAAMSRRRPGAPASAGDPPVAPPLEPMLARAAEQIPSGPGWRYEPKWDGFRAIVFRDGDDVHIGSRKGQPLQRYFPEILDPLREALPGSRGRRRRDHHRHAARARLRRAAAAPPPGRLAGGDARRARPRRP